MLEFKVNSDIIVANLKEVNITSFKQLEPHTFNKALEIQEMKPIFRTIPTTLKYLLVAFIKIEAIKSKVIDKEAVKIVKIIIMVVIKVMAVL